MAFSMTSSLSLLSSSPFTSSLIHFRVISFEMTSDIFRYSDRWDSSARYG